MLSPKSPATGLAAMVLLSLASTPRAAWSDADCRFRADRVARVDTAGAERVEILARAGDLDVRPGAGTTLVGEGRACVSREDYLAATQVHAQRDGKIARVWVDVPEVISGFGRSYATLDLTVSVPAGLPVSITDTSGDLRVDDLAVTSIVDSSGDIVATHLRTDVAINDSSGDMRIENAAGRVTVNDSSGDIVIRGARDVHVVNDSSGDINIERVTGDVLVDNDSSGDISIRDVGQNLTVTTDGSGDVRVVDVRGTVSLPKH